MACCATHVRDAGGGDERVTAWCAASGLRSRGTGQGESERPAGTCGGEGGREGGARLGSRDGLRAAQTL